LELRLKKTLQNKNQQPLQLKFFPPLARLDFENKMKLAQTTLSRRDSQKIARRFNAGNGLACASSPAGTAEPARPFRPSLRDSIHFASPPDVETPGYCRSSMRDKLPARETSECGFSLTPWLQPGVECNARIKNRFNGLSVRGEAIETAGDFRR
jgi:hypothetical protein